ncbi:anthranilate phosphoribosyltransferase [Anseongella ginsenosidimutans]|uniref:Anthranilate phosphoribosyltransferase n=1 Tax=Anseongella ginsenosidimutans TaxID=496056 RepID=A0A4R3KSL0_9SPHI|nr:anthranilate phosphoribosyltransferase [Anseongella ginsenosidimutans]QEC53210.1 anthranilate phosphoribosyltransferase [Anseongella ginsenosidimutans]TCS87843.1 anthranilate phosphoribosyltransferase [Anseongella ginsenosidimutans]
MKEILRHLFEHRNLNREEARRVLVEISSGKHNHSQIAAFMTVYCMRSITVEELGGFRDAMLELCLRADLSEYEGIDIVGTGGDGKNTFNISTLTSFVVAGAGYHVTKHGNYGVSSVSGSSNVLEKLGYTFSNDIDRLRSDLDKSGICFLHAPLFHPSMKNVGPIRKELGIKTFFNMLGPLANPSFPKHQFLGVLNLELARLYNYINQHHDINYAIIHALDGYDEISLTGPFKMYSNSGEAVYQPSDLGLSAVKASAIYGGDSIDAAAAMFRRILEGEGTEEQENVVIANAAMAIRLIEKEKSIADCVAAAAESLRSGKAREVLKKLVS